MNNIEIWSLDQVIERITTTKRIFTHCINISGTIVPFDKHITMLEIDSIDDGYLHPLENVLDIILDFCKDLKPTDKLLVFCNRGVSRSPTVVMAHLIANRKLDFERAYELVKQRHPKMAPNSKFLTMLQNLGRTRNLSL